MALAKTVTTPHQIEASYHKLVKVEYSMQDLCMVLIVAIYASEAARDADAPPLWHEYVKIPFEVMSEDPRTSFYQILTEYYGSYLVGATRDTRPDPQPIVQEPDLPPFDDAPVPPLTEEPIDG